MAGVRVPPFIYQFGEVYLILTLNSPFPVRVYPYLQRTSVLGIKNQQVQRFATEAAGELEPHEIDRVRLHNEIYDTESNSLS